MKELDALKKKALLVVDLSPDTKPQVTSASIQKFVQELKKISARKSAIVVVLDGE